MKCRDRPGGGQREAVRWDEAECARSDGRRLARTHKQSATKRSELSAVRLPATPRLAGTGTLGPVAALVERWQQRAAECVRGSAPTSRRMDRRMEGREEREAAQSLVLGAWDGG